jgi:hypothetical protein
MVRALLFSVYETQANHFNGVFAPLGGTPVQTTSPDNNVVTIQPSEHHTNHT